mgnify:CR=1 FL=1
MPNEFIGGVVLKVLDTRVSPNAYTEIEELKSLSGLGEQVPEIDVTDFNSTAREYIAGLADGNEISSGHKLIHASPSLQAWIVAQKGAVQSFQITHTKSDVSPNLVKTYTFQAVNKGWEIEPDFDSENMINFSFRVTGGITVA